MVDVPSNSATDARFEGLIGANDTFSGSFSSTLEFAADEDWIQVRLVAGTQYTFTLHEADPVTELADPSLTLLDGNGNQVGFDDDLGVGNNSFLTITPTTTGMFFVAVTNFAVAPAEYVVTVAQSAGLIKHELTDAPDTYAGLANELILGGAGNDTINVGFAFQAYGDQGDDTINGGLVGGTLFGGLGNDTVNGGALGETMYGDAGNDVLRGGDGLDDIFGGIGNDSIDGGNLSDGLHGGEGNDSIFGGADAAADILYGDGGNDTLNGGAGADLMSGDAGNDSFVVDNTGDKVSELYGSGIDTVRSSIAFSLANTARVFGAVENLALTGGLAISGTGNTRANVITGNTAANTLDGGLGNDRLLGGNGNDRLFGGAGIDTLTGGLNNDAFVFNTAPNAATNRDVVTDFYAPQDAFLLENAIFTRLGAGVHGLSSAFFRAGAAAADANDYVVYNRATGGLFYDINGNGAGGAIRFATLLNKPLLTASDFVVI